MTDLHPVPTGADVNTWAIEALRAAAAEHSRFGPSGAGVRAAHDLLQHRNRLELLMVASALASFAVGFIPAGTSEGRSVDQVLDALALATAWRDS